jgi:hypothetical protein
MLVALCPSCGKLYLIVDPAEEEKRIKKAEKERRNEAKKHNIDLSYEVGLPPRAFEREYLGEFVPTTRTTLLTLTCEQHKVTRAEQYRWRRETPERARYQYTSGWMRLDGTNVRPCPTCVRWPEPHYTEDLDEQKEYEAKKAGATPAFSLKGRKD